VDVVDDLERTLDRLDDLADDDDFDALAAELRAARRRHPESLELMEWEVVLAADAGHAAEALTLCETVIAKAPRRFWPRRERVGILIDLWRFADALAALDELVPAARAREPEERAALHADRALCLDRLGRPAEADDEFARAERLDPETHFVPLRLEPEAFEELVQDALDGIPEEFAPYLAQVVVTVAPFPEPPAEDAFQLGLYVGLPRSERGATDDDHLDRVVVYQRSHELECPDEESLTEEVRRTVIHEIAHHFGIAHEAMGEFE
jgi:predicted Zn-dependent protease with MMP-like domain